MVNDEDLSTYYPPPERRPYESKREQNWGLIVGGTAVIGLAAVGGYWLWTRQQIVDEYIYWLNEWNREYEEYMDTDGHIPTCGGATAVDCKCQICGEVHDCFWENGECKSPMDKKVERLKTLEQIIFEKGLWDKVIEVIQWGLGAGIIWFILKRLDDYLRKHPPGGSPQGKPYHNPIDNTYHETREHLEDDIRKRHPNRQNPDLNTDAWTEVLVLPAWIVTLLATTVPHFQETWERGWNNTPEWVHNILIGALLAALIAILVLSLGTAAPVVSKTIAACAAACA